MTGRFPARGVNPSRRNDTSSTAICVRRDVVDNVQMAGSERVSYRSDANTEKLALSDIRQKLLGM